MTLLLHRRDVASDAAEGMRSAGGAEATTDLLFDLHHPQIALGEIIIKGNGKVVHKRQRFCLALRQPVEQVLARALLLRATLATRWRGVFAFFVASSLQDSPVVRLVLGDLRPVQCGLLV